MAWGLWLAALFVLGAAAFVIGYVGDKFKNIGVLILFIIFSVVVHSVFKVTDIRLDLAFLLLWGFISMLD